MSWKVKTPTSDTWIESCYSQLCAGHFDRPNTSAALICKRGPPRCAGLPPQGLMYASIPQTKLDSAEIIAISVPCAFVPPDEAGVLYCSVRESAGPMRV
ncbi:uncharacterized protein L969DRAFT_93534 [Mixia osmundae IAM 14324]|uniref:Uncharacterized protein n=1 Tax=Mixia osmundae (strain CBS 9802 / IAM 14324 / JCM 22182 / KY 12970) TaxID=764103 RepID=G7DU92_MIXOS|nr:uncharacterized protein L969DRAFT_93534 [Mixia osmundae IAM 14324]KEI41023.1 hypothetical protein L969DRAFT_93534 [Mixia osmundae IAM 14324]GAA94152.1 hypothetical protein E5Q_00800 [Mixia osmundae IAM 14324]